MRWIIFAWLLSCSLAQASGGYPAVVGEAYSLDRGTLLYREMHFIDDGGLDRRVMYRAPQGETLAVKVLDYRSGLATPSFSEQDLRSGEWRMVERLEKSLLLKYRPGDHNKPRHSTVAIKAPLVIDAGFDHFIRQHWSPLLEGETLDFSFPVASRGTLMQFSLQSTRCANFQQLLRSLNRQDLVCFEIRPAGWLVGFFVDPITLVYARGEQRLLVYRGLANIADGEGNEQLVEIHYHYPGVPMAALEGPVNVGPMN